TVRGICPVNSKLRTGRYEIVARKEGFEPAVQHVEIRRNAVQILGMGLQAESGLWGMDTASLLSYSLIGVGAATLVGAVISDSMSVSRLEELRAARNRGDAAGIIGLREEADSASTRTAILYGVGAAVLAGGVAWKIVQITSETP